MPVTFPFSVKISLTFSFFTVHPYSPNVFLSAFTISWALSDTGKTRLPLSVLRGTPAFSKNAFVSLVSKLLIDAYRNLGFEITFFKNSLLSQSFVTLHLPLPVMASFLPRRSFFSKRVTDAPFIAP